MRVVYEYSHLGGSEILHLRFPLHEKDIYQIMGGISAEKTKVSREKTMPGRELY